MQTLSIPVPADESKLNEYEANNAMAFADVINGFKNYELWHYIAMAEIRRRYRRTILGPFWTTLSIGLFIGCMSVVLSALWNTSPKDFLPYFTAGYIAWILLSTLINDGCNTLIANEIYLKQLSIPYVIYACLTTWRNFIVFSHHLLIYALVLLYCFHPVNFNLLFIVPGLLLIFFTGVCISLLLGMLCARYRDVQQIIASMLQLAMFVTPIMWKPEQLGKKGILITKLNPLFHYISLIRMPLLGAAPAAETWVITFSITVLVAICTYVLFTKKYRTLIYWL